MKDNKTETATSMIPAPRPVTVYAINTDTVRKSDLKKLKEHMPSRMEKASRYRIENDRLLCEGAGLLLMDIVKIPDESLLKEGKYGKLYAPGFPPFSISHSGNWCILAMDELAICKDPAETEDAGIGVDIEKTDRMPLNIARRVCTDPEINWMIEAPEERFMILWTLKESVMKATGQGFFLDPRSFNLLPMIEGASIKIGKEKLYGATSRIDRYRFSVCAPYPIRCLNWEEYQSSQEV